MVDATFKDDEDNKNPAALHTVMEMMLMLNPKKVVLNLPIKTKLQLPLVISITMLQVGVVSLMAN